MTGQRDKVKGVVDLVFLIDATGSMAPCISALKENIATFIDSLTTGDANNARPVKDWRGKVVGFRDYEVDAEPLVDNDFVRDAAALKEQLAKLEAAGGGDEPETLLDALHVVATMPETPKGAEEPNAWRRRSEAARVVVVFTDASYKPNLLRKDVAGGTFDDVRNAVENARIMLNVFAPDMPCYDALSQIQRVEYEAIPGDNPQQALVDYTADQEHFRTVLSQLARTVSGSAVADLEPAQ